MPQEIQKLKVAILSKSDKSGGGASQVAERLVFLLNQTGYIAHHYHAGNGYNKYTKKLYGNFQWLFVKLSAVFRKIGLGDIVPFELPHLILAMKKEQYDIIHFHDTSSAISPLTIKYFAKKYPVLWTLHDCSPVTGGCLNPLTCTKYTKTCFRCPQLGRWPLDSKLDLTFLNHWLKKKVHHAPLLTLITPSRWMADFALKSNTLAKPPVVIPNSFNLDVFQYINKQEIRKTLGLPVNRTILLISAGNLQNIYKGVSFFMQTLWRIKDLNPFILFVGETDDKLEKLVKDFDYATSGYISDDDALNQFYGAADIFLNCSLADSFSLTTVECMASGTPVVGFATGGIPELIEQGKSGFLVPTYEVDTLAKVLREILRDKTYVQWGKNARIHAVEHFTQTSFIDKHIKLYHAKVTNEDK